MESVILALHKASLDQNKWAEALQKVSQFTGSCAAVLEFLQLPDTSVRLDASYGYDAQVLVDSIGTDLADFDPWLKCVAEEPDSNLHIGSKYVSARDVRMSAFYNEGLRRVDEDWRDVMATLSPLSDGSSGVLAVYRHGQSDNFSYAEMERMRALQPHIQQALEVASRLQGFALREELNDQLSSSRGDALIGLDANGRLIFANNRAERLLRQLPAVFAIRNGRLRIANCVHANARLQKALDFCLLTKDASSIPAGGSVIWQRGHERYSACLTPHMNRLLPEQPWVGHSGTAIMVTVRTSRPDSAGIAARAQYAFELTPAETRLLSKLINGLSISDVCEYGGVSMNTVKSQCRSIYRKTGTSNHASLLHLCLTRFPA